MKQSELRAREVLIQAGFDATLASTACELLQQSGLAFADRQLGEFVCSWVNTLERAVPPEADTIIRTVTRSFEGRTSSATHWLAGLEPPPPPPEP